MDAPPSGDRSKLEGVLEQIVYRNDENGYTVARLLLKGAGRTVTVTGGLLGVSPGESVRCRGEWTLHERFGRQFRVDSCEVIPPATEKGIVLYLSSGLVKGIGPKLAAAMVKTFGMETLRIIEEEPARIREVPGIGAQRAADIARAWGVQKDIQEIMVFLRGYGVGQALAAKIYARYGRDTVRLIKQNPYRLCGDVFGVGFKPADRIAQNLGVDPDSPFRIRAVIAHLLDLAASDGHLCLPYPLLVDRAVETAACAPEQVEEQIAQGSDTGGLVVEERYVAPFLEEEGDDRRLVFLRALHDAEKGVHARLRILKHAPKRRIAGDPFRALQQAERESGLSLDDSQREAVQAALKKAILVITGGPGVGKTTIVRLIARIFRKAGFRIALAAPTGRAAKRLSESTGFPASTIHRLLKFNPRTRRFDHDRENPLPCDLLIVDECSMIDVPVAEGLLQAVPGSARILFVGDADQLPSVGPGDFLRSLIDSGRFPVARLTTLFRQRETGGITMAAHAVNRGVIPEFAPAGGEGEIFFADQPIAEKTADLVVRLVRERIPGRFGLDPVRDIQVLTPMHKGPAGTEKLNAALRAALNPGHEGLARRGTTFRSGDKVMQIRNNYDLEVFNGDIGFVEDVDLEHGRLQVRMDDALVTYEPDNLDELVHAYCVSVHKSQGCEFPAVVMPLLTQHFLLLKRNLLYTGITRARRLLVIVGAHKALRIAVGNDSVLERHSLLENRLRFDGEL